MRDTLINKIDEIRYTFIDELKEFYDQERENMEKLQTSILEDKNMVEIYKAIAEIDSRENKIDGDDELLLDPIKITEESKNAAHPGKAQMHMTYNVGDASEDSDKVEHLETTDAKHTQEGRKESLNVTPVTKKTPKKGLSYMDNHEDDLSELNLETDLSVNVEKRKDNSVKKVKSVHDSSAVKDQLEEVEELEIEIDEDEEKEEAKSEETVYKGVESAIWLNQLAKVVYSWYTEKQSKELTDILCKKLHKVYNDDDKPSFLGEIKVLDVVLGGVAPNFLSFKKLEAAPHEFLGDVDLSYRGTLEITLSTEVHLNWRSTNYALIPITLKVKVKGVTGKLRIFLTQNMERMNWYAFVGQPNIRFEIDLIIGKDNKMSFSVFPKVKKFIEDMFSKKMYKFVLPNKKRLEMPFFPDKKLMF